MWFLEEVYLDYFLEGTSTSSYTLQNHSMQHYLVSQDFFHNNRATLKACSTVATREESSEKQKQYRSM